MLGGTKAKLRAAAADFKLHLLSKRRPLRVIIGSASTKQSGWVSTDIGQLNLLDANTWQRYFMEGSINALLAEHVWEHLAEDEAVIAATNCYRYLKPGGYLRVAVPDGFHPSEQYIDAVKPGGTGWGSDDHKVLYNYKKFSNLFRLAGFEVKLLEWFDENGEFHFIEWDRDDGMIMRSCRFDKRNVDSPLAYTSLVLDAIKE